MNQFKKVLRGMTTKQIDERISANIISELEKLEQELGVEEDRECIRQRKQGVKQVLVSFDRSMEVIEKKQGFRIVKSKEEEKINSIEQVMQKRVWERLEKLYQYTMSYGKFESEQDRGKELNQILDRQARIRVLLEQYDENMDLIKSVQTVNQNKQMVL